jgi:hypothetical protein
MSLFSISVARDSLTRRIRPRRSAASGRRICERMEERWSAGMEGQWLAAGGGFGGMGRSGNM